VYEKDPNHRALLQTATLGRHDCVGLLDLFLNREYSATVKTDVVLTCVKMEQESFNHLVRPVMEDMERKTKQ
jgi:CRP-like cAMP-binding protein